MKIIYVCERPYNTYRTLLHAANSDNEMDLVLTNNIEGMEAMCDELRKSGLFGKVYFFNELKHKTFFHPLKMKNNFSIRKFADIKRVAVLAFRLIGGFVDYIKSQRKARHIKLPDGLDFDKYDEIHITDCNSIMNFYLYYKKYDNLIYVEHAKNALSETYPNITYLISLLTKLRLVYGIRGSYRRIRAIEVNKTEGLHPDTKNKEIREIPLESLVDALSTEQKNFIYQIYAKSFKFDFPSDSIIDLFLTTSNLGPVELNMFVHVCKEVIKNHMYDADYIVIKPHPNDRVDYSELSDIYSNVVLLPSSFSAEMFLLSSTLKVRNFIVYESSSTGAFIPAEKCVLIDAEFIDKCRESFPTT